jgi:hypothetical protein
MVVYPTKEEILAISYKLKPIHIWLTLTWRDTRDYKAWKNLDKEDKIVFLSHDYSPHPLM